MINIIHAVCTSVLLIRPQQIRDEWHKQDNVIKTAANKIVQYPESISEVPLKAVMSPGNQYKVHYKKKQWPPKH